MTDILIRAVPSAIIDEIDRQARELGISRTTFLRRRLDREFRTVGGLSTDDLVRLAQLFCETSDRPDTELGSPELVDGSLA